MNTTHHPWRALLLEMSTAFSFPLLLRWTMSNGAIFQMLLPKQDEFSDVSLANHLEFGFTYEEIVSVRIEVAVPHFLPPPDIDLRLAELLKQHQKFDLLNDSRILAITFCDLGD